MKSQSVEVERSYSIKHTAELFDVSPEAVYIWLKRGQLAAIHTPGGAVRIRERDIATFMRGQTEESPSA